MQKMIKFSFFTLPRWQAFLFFEKKKQKKHSQNNDPLEKFENHCRVEKIRFPNFSNGLFCDLKEPFLFIRH